MAKVALLIGVSEYEPGLNPLPGAVKDVEAMQQVLLHAEMGGFTETDIMVLKNPQRQDMEEAIENLFAHRQKDDLLVLFFSGHGIKDDTGRLFLATRTTHKTPRGDLIRSSAVAASVIHESMSRSRSKRQVIILDSCFSGAFAEGLSAKDDGTVDIREQLGGEGRAVLTSSSSTQYSFEQQGSDLSIYTRYLIEGITTGAADLDEDGVVSIDELHEYASLKVREIQPTIKPEIYTSREGFKIRLTKVPQGDPKQKYRKEVARYNNRGEVTFVGRKILDALRSHLGLSEVEATAIEDEMLATSRLEFREKLQRYERDFTEALQQTVALSADEVNSLRQNLQ
ncbi:caspase domain-containing protein [Nostoc sp. PA-18-2419]|uniref:caspase family protein n=1 Tax=Nostoc sp. PA-18-2419 TaxID=2575443 RepID=UPI0011083152|nr:caspase family protein [Nostoc sp. PA-18-2419]